MPEIVAIFLLVSVMLAFLYYGIRLARLYSSIYKLYTEYQKSNPLYVHNYVQYQITDVGTGHADKWQPGMFGIKPDGISIYRYKMDKPEPIFFDTQSLRWYGRPKKYEDGDNEIWLHFETDDQWKLLKVRLNRYAMQDLVRAMKKIGTPEQLIAYRRRRPYIHFGPIEVHPAEQDIHGAWTLDIPAKLYLNPMSLVIMREGKVLRNLPLSSIQQIGALKRLDKETADGLVRFQMDGEPFAFAVKQHEQFAHLLAEAAKRTLEAPLIQKAKSKELEEDDELIEAYEPAPILDYSDFVIGDDGEIHMR